MTRILPFNNGVCEVFTTTKRTKKESLGRFNFHEETIGISSYTDFQTLGIEIEKVISIPYNNLVENGKIVKLSNDEDYYVINLIQVKDTLPKSLKLTLSKTTVGWNDD